MTLDANVLDDVIDDGNVLEARRPVNGNLIDASTKHPVIWVGPSSSVPMIGNQVVEAIHVPECERVTLRAIGAGAVNQAVKGAVHARQQLAANGEDMVMRPGCVTVEGNDGGEVTAVVLHCFLDW